METYTTQEMFDRFVMSDLWLTPSLITHYMSFGDGGLLLYTDDTIGYDYLYRVEANELIMHSKAERVYPIQEHLFKETAIENNGLYIPDRDIKWKAQSNQSSHPHQEWVDALKACAETILEQAENMIGYEPNLNDVVIKLIFDRESVTYINIEKSVYPNYIGGK